MVENEKQRDQHQSALQVFSPTSSWLNPGWLKWNKYSEVMLRAFEKQIFKAVKTKYRGFYVDIGPVVGPTDKIWTISLNTESKKPPLVLLHGLGGAVALWCMNLDSLAEKRPVYAIDLLGFGRSSRPVFSTDSVTAELQMIKAIEEWRKELNLEKFILLGHSFGGFLATSYAISYPDRVHHVILCDPWGFVERPKEESEVPFWIRALSFMATPFNPMTPVRVIGPLGMRFLTSVRTDLLTKFSSVLDDVNVIPQYVYQVNAQTPTGESGFHCMMNGFGWAKHPMEHRIHKLKEDIPITLIYGATSWMDHSATDAIRDKRTITFLKVIQGAGHHVYIDRPEVFNNIVLAACQYTDNELKKQNNLAIMPKSDDEKK